MKERMIRVMGNFGISFLTPMAGTQIVLGSEFIDSIYVAVVSAGIVTGISLSREAASYGADKNES
jgi:hypothetical protein